MPPRGFHKLLTVVHLLVIASFVVQPIVPTVAKAAVIAANDERPVLQEEEETPVEPIEEFPSGFEELPQEPPLEPENLVENTQMPDVVSAPLEMELPPLPNEPLAPQPMPVPADQPGANVPVELEVSQDRYVMASGETTKVSITLYPRYGQDPAPVQLSLTPSSNLVAFAGTNTWSVPPLQEGEVFTQQVDLLISTGELSPSGAVISFTVEASAPNFDPMTWKSWLGLLPEGTPPAEPLTDTVTVSAISASQQSELGSVLEYKDRAGETGFLLLAAPGAVPAGTKFTYTDLTSQVAPSTQVPAPALGELKNPVFLPSVKSDNQFVVASSHEITHVEPITTIDGVGIYAMWHLTATQSDGSGVNQFDEPVLLMFSVDEWAEAGLDMETVQLVTRQDSTRPWKVQPGRYDEKRQVWITRVNHFSDFALGAGLGSGFDVLPSMSGFAEGGYTGAATYNYPLEAPNGLGGLNPNLSLSYSSSVPDNVAMNVDYNSKKIQASVVGYGWEISGISYIARVQHTDPEDENKEYYTMVIDGQRVDIIGVQTPTATGYRTNPEIFAKITYAAPTDNSIWTVKMPNGLTYTFGGKHPKFDVNDADVTMVIAKHTSPDKKLKYDKWMLTKVQDISGNYIDYSYWAERLAPHETEGCRDISSWYSSAIRLTQVRWSGNGTSGSVIQPMLQMNFTYDSRSDIDISTGDALCGQKKMTTQRLSSVEVMVLESPGGMARLIRKYELTPTYDDGSDRENDGEDGNDHKHLLLESITQKGNDGQSILHTTTFDYKNIPDENGPTVNNVRLREVVTGYGAIVLYDYGFRHTYNCGPDLDDPDYACFDSFWPVTKKKVFSGIPDPDPNDGFNSWTTTVYTYSEALYYTHVTPYGKIGEWLGVEESKETTYAATNSETTTGAVIRYLYTEYYRNYLQTGDSNPEDAKPDPRKGKIHRQELYNADGGITFYRSNHAWNFFVDSDTDFGDDSWSGWSSTTNVPDIDDVVWLRQDTKDEWTDGVGKRTQYYYDASMQDGSQYGNVTRIYEYSHDEPGQSDTVAYNDFSENIVTRVDIPYSTWQARLTATPANITSRRRTVFNYYPTTGSTYIVNLPARKRVGNGTSAFTDTANFNCFSDSRYIYASGTNYQVAPTSTKLIREQHAISSCSTAADIPDDNVNWAVTIYAYDGWGNQTDATTKGSVDQILETTYDDIYHMFPVKQRLTSNPPPASEPFEFAEHAKYYGVNLSMSDAANAWTGGRFAWGKLAQHCTVNSVCTFQSYDRHGRPVRRWERVGSGVNPADADADVYWSYHMPYGPDVPTLPTYRITEWRSPRCFGNFVRRHYNGLGQLYMEQTPYQDWQENYEGCGAADGLGREIRVNYAYNALGKVQHASVPQLIARSDDEVYDINWGTIAKSTTTYDALGRAIESIAFNGEKMKTAYEGRITMVDAIGRNGESDRRLSWVMVDGLGYQRLIRTYKKESSWQARAQVLFSTNVLGHVTQMILPNNLGTATMEYNIFGLKTEHIDPDAGVEWNLYDRQGRLVKSVAGDGQRRCFYYNYLGQLGVTFYINNDTCPASASSVPTNVIRSVGYIYNEGATSNRGQLTRIQSYNYANSVVTSLNYREAWSYNSNGLLASDKVVIATHSNGEYSYTTSYEYDDWHRPDVVVYPHGRRAMTGYDSMGLPVSLCEANASNACIGDIVNNVVRDEAGRITSMNFPASQGYQKTFQYYGWTGTDGDSLGRLKQIKVTDDSVITGDSATKLQLEYKYDSFGNVTELKDGNTTSNIVYDYLNRVHDADGLSNRWGVAGQPAPPRPIEIEGKSVSYTRPMAPSSVGTFAYTWNSAGGLETREFKTATVAGTEGSQDLQWGIDNRLAAVVGTGYDGNALTEEYLYKIDGQRIRKYVDIGSDNSPEAYLYYPSQYFHHNGSSGYNTAYYYFGSMLVAQRTNSSPLLYLYGDQVDSVRLAADKDDTDATAGKRRYTAYGDRRSGDTYTSLGTEYGYSGQRTDGTGLVYMNARYYDPQMGMFISPDTIIPDPTNVMDYNRYTYGRGNPISNNDPTGHLSEDQIRDYFGYSAESRDALQQTLINDGWTEDLANWLMNPDTVFGEVISYYDGEGRHIGETVLALFETTDKVYRGGFYGIRGHKSGIEIPHTDIMAFNDDTPEATGFESTFEDNWYKLPVRFGSDYRSYYEPSTYRDYANPNNLSVAISAGTLIRTMGKCGAPQSCIAGLAIAAFMYALSPASHTSYPVILQPETGGIGNPEAIPNVFGPPRGYYQP